MSYQALARKWRPRTFSQLVGQNHINKALINALNQQRLHHAYLFTGTRGVGKTSIARILAKSLNCEKGVCSEPCLQCNACNAIEQGRFIDLIEIDGASRTRVEDTRDLLDNVQYAPANGRFKVYLIDEVHMLSQHSFNALLKTLEEPPEHVKFILATTDPQKLPVTVLSRCLQFNLKNLSEEIISQQIQLILKKEQFEFEIQAVEILAQAARGSMRDALSLLDQAISGCETQLTTDDVKMILGYTQQDYALQLLHALAESNALMVLSINQQISSEGGHFQYVLDELLHYLYQTAVFQLIGDHNPLIHLSEAIKTIAERLSKEDIQLFYQIGLKGREEIHLAPTLSIGFNMTILRMLAFRPASPVTAPPLALYKQATAAQPAINPPKEQATPSISKEYFEPQSLKKSDSNESQKKKKIESQDDVNDWSRIISHLKLTGLALNAADNAELVSQENQRITLRVAKGHQSLFTPTITLRIENALSEYYQKQYKLVLISEELMQPSPAQQKRQAAQNKQHKAETALYNDPVFQQIQQEFSAELVKNSIVPLEDDL